MNVVKESEIAAPPEKVYEYLVDFPRHSEWTTPGHGVTIKPASEGPTAVGSAFECDAHQFGSQHDRISVTELDPARRIVYDVTMKDGSTFRHTFELQPSGTGTRLSKRFQSVKLKFPGSLFAPIAGLTLAPASVQGDLDRIKAHLEQPSTEESAKAS